MSEQAVQDIIFLGKRLSGVIALADELTDYDTLKNQTSELKDTVSKLQAEVLDLQAGKDAIIAFTDAVKRDIFAMRLEGQVEVDRLLAAANTDAQSVYTNMVKKAQADISAMEQQKQTRLDEIQRLTEAVQRLKEERDTVEKTLLSFQQELQQVRSKFS